MFKGKFINKWIAIALTLSLLFSLQPNWFAGEAKAATVGEDKEVRFGAGTRLGNLSYDADNAFLNFNIGTAGFTKISSSGTIDWADGGVYPNGDDGAGVDLTIRVQDNPTLLALAQSEHAEAVVGWNRLLYNEFDCVLFWCKTRVTSATIEIDGVKLSDSSHQGTTSAKSMKRIITPTSVIKVGASVEGQGAGAVGMYIKFQDKTRPRLTGYTFTGNGAERDNTKINQKELYVKQNENITFAYEFSEPVKPTTLVAGNADYFLRHPLFVNPDGTGLPTAGEQQYLKNETYTTANLGTLHPSIVYRYTGSKYHHSGNLPLEPKMTGTTSGVAPIDMTLEEKLRSADLTDEAGNAAVIELINKANSSSNSYLRSKTVDPFDFNHEGYRVIIDAVAPKYTKVGNGIQPEILTGVTLNKDDTFDFTLQLTEEAVVKTGWKVEETFLYLNNGEKAYYVSGQGTANWTFRTKIPTGLKVETPLLKVIALSHNDKPDLTDTNVIQDYAGNMLIQPANYYGIHEDGDRSNVNSKIDEAKLSIDNTKPDISFHYESWNGQGEQKFLKFEKVTIDANDPPLLIPFLDPNVSERGKEKPSNGIYRPSNMTGPASPSVGLVYYFWSQSPADPFASKSGDNFAAVKRYTLAGKQPREELYPGDEFAKFNFSVVNNKTNMIAPPAEALTEENSGLWYLHSWTADMTWDSARELMQYDKKKSYVQSHPNEYEAWKAEAAGSEAEKVFYADNKALAKVGQYGELDVWPLTDYKKEDSNWSYNVAMIKLDNKAPKITIDPAVGDNTADVKVQVTISDDQSGVKRSFYQWIKEGQEPTEQWNSIASAAGQVLSTLNEVIEDGKYSLYIKSEDLAGNERVTKSANAVTINSNVRIPVSFSPEANPNYVKSHDIEFHISGLGSTQSVTGASYGNSVSNSTYGSQSNSVSSVTYSTYSSLMAGVPTVSYAFNDSTLRPAKSTDFTTYSEANGNRTYVVPADVKMEGEQYIHIKVREADGRENYFYKKYYFDNTPPKVTFSTNGVAYPLSSHKVIVSVEDAVSKNVTLKKYKWVKNGEAPPSEDPDKWTDLPATGETEITNSTLAVGETKDFQLYVWARDIAGNSIITGTSGFFKVSKNGGVEVPPAEGKSDLIYVYGDNEDGYTAIVKLSLDTLDKSGYEYSVSPDGGQRWLKWRPYTNFVSIKVPTNKVTDLHIKVKYKTPGGAIGKEIDLTSGSVQAAEPIYALATQSTLTPVNPTKGVDIDIAAPLGIKVVASAVNPSVPVRTSNKFNVKTNGYYSFDLTDTSDASRKDTLYVVVSNVDGEAPVGSITKLITAKTNGNVSVKLDASEPILITNNDGKAVHTFTENGSFEFEFMDEAGNTAKAPVTVDNIYKEGPQVKVVRSYAYGENGSQTFKTIKDGNGNVLLASGVTLEVQNVNSSSPAFRVPDGKRVVSLQQNGVASFTVYDDYGNMTTIKEEVNNIVSAVPKVDQIIYTFVDDAGNELPADKLVNINGQPYAKGNVKVTLSGHMDAPNKLFMGVVPDLDNYTNQISGQDGKFTVSKIYSAQGSTLIGLVDALGNVNKVPVTIKGLDNKAPELQLKMATVAVAQNKSNFDFRVDLGGFTVSDNISQPDQINVAISGLDLTKLGRQRVTYTAKDQVGNTTVAYQDVVVVGSDGMLIFANDILISSSSGETALFNTNKLTFGISRYNLMEVNGQERVNEWGTFDLLYQPGLYREGQMKYLASKVSYKELLNGHYEVTFPQVGWYTLIVRNQEREREYATFFIGKTE
ncbi:hypothetical protein [Paenibacillus radicis (ex Xue et al. 2023)]|uniref:Ig-like domain-containing protein n=1 Tax=Paenibacillus radicis (ex Xue et al. 2023) TaxID=2972489 RepID=A0ABT1YTL5_9BACL|nr:hypothetical protein [Paenibacillus radicis (ex Xue et al. 2023)]MCR8636519.1 hypothetical protein [Paenibacillus radicis (ex Xue et al. 2023)]